MLLDLKIGTISPSADFFIKLSQYEKLKFNLLDNSVLEITSPFIKIRYLNFGFFSPLNICDRFSPTEILWEVFPLKSVFCHLNELDFDTLFNPVSLACLLF